MRLIEATFEESCAGRIREAVETADPIYHRLFEADESGKRLLKVFLDTDEIQEFLDRLQAICEGSKDWRILVLPVEATAPPIPEDKGREAERKSVRRAALREEIYKNVSDGAAFSLDFILLTLASTVVAAIGLNTDNVAAVIGAMVIAPLLGPILAFTFAAALGAGALLVQSARSALAGLFTGVAAAALISVAMPVNFASHELMSRTVVGLDSIALALAAGGAAALSIATGAPSALVGVMVAVALLPPAAAAGLFLGAGEFVLAGRAALLLTVNIVCIMLAAQGVYAYKGIRPRRWLTRRAASQTVRVQIAILAALLVIAAAIILFTPTEVMPVNPVGD